MRVNRQPLVAWSNCASHEPKIKTPQGRFNNVLYQVRLPHFVKTSCGTPSRELFRFGLPAHRHRREGWLGQLIPSDIYEYMSCGAFVSVQTAQCLFSLTHCRTKQQIVAWSNCASHEPKIKTPQWLGQLDSNQH